MNDSVPSGRASKSDELLALAARCEQEEPSRELDESIRLAVGADRMCFGAPDGCYVTYDDYTAAEYTTSLDAAVTLVPEGCMWSVSSYTSAFVHLPRDADLRVGGGRTSALRLCAAALRARAAIASQESGETLRDPKALHHTQGR